jgi:hypothetical protein
MIRIDVIGGKFKPTVQIRVTDFLHNFSWGTCSMDTDMQQGHAHVAWKRKCSLDMDMDVQHGFGLAT